ncbi:MAG: DNA recombination protein RmuC [Phycisphaerae bacterium]|nr:DNA recombination protein RmuC [Phycisphaerae bacterium]
MIMVFAIVGIVIGIVLTALMVWVISSTFASRRDLASQSAGIGMLQQQLEALKASQDAGKDAMEKSLQNSQESISTNMQSSQKVLSILNNQIGELHGTNKQMLQMGNDVRRLQDILSSPKLRGNMGEWSLKNILETVLPAGSYSLQHSFKDGKIVDALIKTSDYSVPVDAKFPLPGFERIANAENDEQRVKVRRQFLRDVTAHVDKIASQYIRPKEGTLDFALMYIPAENVYYESMIKFDGDNLDVLSYAMEKKVIAVSPNLLYVYLMTIVMGLHGLQIEKQAAQIRQNLRKLNSDFAEFMSNWNTLGNHIRNTGNKYDETDKRLDRFGMQLVQIQEDGETAEAHDNLNVKEV